MPRGGRAAPGDLSFEEALALLETKVQALTAGRLTVEEALEAFEEGVELYRHCSAKLREAEQRVTKLVETLKGIEEVPLDRGPGREAPGGAESPVP